MSGTAQQLPDDPVAKRVEVWWERGPFDLLRTVIDVSPSSLRTEALIVVERLERDIARLREAEALGDA